MRKVVGGEVGMVDTAEISARRPSLFESTGSTYYTWDDVRVLKMMDGEGALRQRQVHGPSPSGIPSVGDMAMIESAAGDAYTPDSDQVGTIHKVLDSAANAVSQYSYDAFGVARSATETFANPYRFAGKPLDPDSALYHFIARQYEADLGRFTGRDPHRLGIGREPSNIAIDAVVPSGWRPHEYSYAANTPERYVDPFGLATSVVAQVTFGALTARRESPLCSRRD